MLLGGSRDNASNYTLLFLWCDKKDCLIYFSRFSIMSSAALIFYSSKELFPFRSRGKILSYCVFVTFRSKSLLMRLSLLYFSYSLIEAFVFSKIPFWFLDTLLQFSILFMMLSIVLRQELFLL